ncbi:MAG TPA: hypothetical protein PKU91_02500 [Phycisphaerales bacterium]|nr:hypothetical protein [Phycisphaerales bacterium]
MPSRSARAAARTSAAASSESRVPPAERSAPLKSRSRNNDCCEAARALPQSPLNASISAMW